jgi:hypothetical protein
MTNIALLPKTHTTEYAITFWTISGMDRKHNADSQSFLKTTNWHAPARLA